MVNKIIDMEEQRPRNPSMDKTTEKVEQEKQVTYPPLLSSYRVNRVHLVVQRGKHHKSKIVRNFIQHLVNSHGKHGDFCNYPP
jgi:hypothetical protein